MIIINLAKDYSDTPGGRFIKDGPYSGEDFRETMLIPKYNEALETNEILQINLDGCFGYPSSFIDEAFGGLARYKKSHDILNAIKIISNDEPRLIEEINKCVKEAEFGR